MRKFDISGVIKSTQKTARTLMKVYNAHRHEIMAAEGIIGYLGSIYLMYRNAGAIKEGIEEKDVKKVAKAAAPVVITAGLSTAAVIGSVKTGNRRYAAMSAAYTLTDAAFTEYKDSAKELLGEKKEAKIDQTSVDKEIKRTPVDYVIDTGHGTTLCYERLTGRYFYSDINFIKSAVNNTNELFDEGEDVVRLEDLHYQLDIESTDMSKGFAWLVSYGRIRVDYTSHLAPNGDPCLAISYRNLGLMTDPYDTDTFIPLTI